MQVTILLIRKNRTPIQAGVIRLDARNLMPDPPASRLLQHIIQSPIYVTIDGQPRELRSEPDSERFLEHLHVAYNGPYLRATKAEP